MTRPVSGSGSWKITNAATISVTMEATVDIAPTQTTSMPDLTAEPLVIACRTWISPHAIATIQNVVFKLSGSQFSKLGRKRQRPVDEARLAEKRRQAI